MEIVEDIIDIDPEMRFCAVIDHEKGQDLTQITKRRRAFLQADCTKAKNEKGV
jgi:hypothetical protein